MAKKLTAAEELAALKARTESYRKARDPESAVEPAVEADEAPVEEKKPAAPVKPAAKKLVAKKPADK